MPSNTRGNVVPADTIVNLSVDYNLEIGEIYNLQCVGGSSGLLYLPRGKPHWVRLISPRLIAAFCLNLIRRLA